MGEEFPLGLRDNSVEFRTNSALVSAAMRIVIPLLNGHGRNWRAHAFV